MRETGTALLERVLDKQPTHYSLKAHVKAQEMYRTDGHTNPGKEHITSQYIRHFHAKGGVFGVSSWSSRRRFSGARDGPSSAALKRLNCPTVTPRWDWTSTRR